MCDSAVFSAKFQWGFLARLARADFKPAVPKGSGIYCLRVQKAGITDMSRIIDEYKNTGVMKALKVLADASRTLFRAASLADDYGWEKFSSTFGFDTATDRLNRLGRIQTLRGRLVCPILYIGSTSNLRTRLDELAFGGHTANHAVWPLLLSGWQLEVGWKQTTDYRTEENELKELYKNQHSGSLPPLVDR